MRVYERDQCQVTLRQGIPQKSGLLHVAHERTGTFPHVFSKPDYLLFHKTLHKFMTINYLEQSIYFLCSPTNPARLRD